MRGSRRRIAGNCLSSGSCFGAADTPNVLEMSQVSDPAASKVQRPRSAASSLEAFVASRKPCVAFVARRHYRDRAQTSSD